MTQEKVSSLLIKYKDVIPSDRVAYLKNALEKADQNAYETISSCKIKNPTTTLILSIFLGILGVDRFFIDDIGLGVAKLLFGWMTFGLWPFIDIFCSYKKVKEKNLNNLITYL